MNRSHRSATLRNAFCDVVALDMRRDQTEAELAMGSILRDLGLRFEEQYVVEGSRNEILDFYIANSPVSGTAIEVDGPEHKKGPDRRRDTKLWMEHSIRTIRFKNDMVLKHPEAVSNGIRWSLGLDIEPVVR